ncbi:hypothetical protein PENTCL1PPCAC_12228, partial [Pristionchus entomophagus]
ALDDALVDDDDYSLGKSRTPESSQGLYPSLVSEVEEDESHVEEYLQRSVDELPEPETDDLPLWHIANERLREKGVPRIVMGGVIFEPGTLLLALVSLLCYGFFGLSLVIFTVLFQTPVGPNDQVPDADLVPSGPMAPIRRRYQGSTTPSGAKDYPWFMPRTVTAHYT